MSAAVVVDCSVAMSWCFTDEATRETDALLVRMIDEGAVVPGLWFLEVANVLAVAERRRRIARAEVEEFLSVLEQIDLEVDGEVLDGAFGRLLPLCREHGLTSYDAVYLELASRRGLPLATLDRSLGAAAKRIRVTLVAMS